MKITLVRSLIGVRRDQRATVRALGLRKVHDTREVPDRTDVRGMLQKVSTLLKVDNGP
jgi:large subunit ribosomal protein L30